MGMSASQARLLSITSRLTNNEFRAQTITNSKLRLASESEEASRKYMDALESKKLMYGVYDDNGDRTYTDLTANVLLSYGDLKNQYSLVNSSGQIMLNGSDIKNYMNAQNITEFMDAYGIPRIVNPEYTETLTNIFGKNYEELVDDTNYNKYTLDNEGNNLEYLGKIDGFVNAINENGIDSISQGDIDNYKASLNSANLNKSVYNASSANMLNNYIYALNDIPDKVENPGTAPEKVEKPDLLDYADELLSPVCWGWTGIENLRNNTGEFGIDQIAHVEHVLAQYLWSDGYGAGSMTTDYGTITKRQTQAWSVTGGGATTGNGYVKSSDYTGAEGQKDIDPMKVQTVLGYSKNSDLKRELQNLYFIILYKYAQNGGTPYHQDTGNSNQNFALLRGCEIAGTFDPDSIDEVGIGEKYLDLVNKLLIAVADDILDKNDSRYYSSTELQNYLSKYEEYKTYTKDLAEWNENKSKYDNYVSAFKDWLNSVNNKKEDFENAIKNIPTKEISDKTDAKYQWYLNLWERMGAGKKDAAGNIDATGFKEIDENLINNSEWLEFAFEHGILTLEQAQFMEDGSTTYPEMGQYDWVSKPYTNATDIVSKEDEIAIAIAEVKYKKEITEIENKDKKYDQDLKKLDTEHNALQTEYESIKEVISKNTERSFKAFS